MEYLGIDIGGTTTKMGVVTNNEIKNVTIFNTDKNIEKFLSVLIQKINLYKFVHRYDGASLGKTPRKQAKKRCISERLRQLGALKTPSSEKRLLKNRCAKYAAMGARGGKTKRAQNRAPFFA